MKRMISKPPTRQAKRFDPFSDRLSRDVRNSLSVAFIRSLEEEDGKLFEQKAQEWLDQGLAPLYREYIENRLRRYRGVLDQIGETRASNLLTRAACLWNAGLFFEVHELLEGFWRKTSGDERQALKALIKAATAYAHLDVGNQKAWESLCAKSAKLLEEHRGNLPFLSNLDVLIEKLAMVEVLAASVEQDGWHLLYTERARLHRAVGFLDAEASVPARHRDELEDARVLPSRVDEPAR